LGGQFFHEDIWIELKRAGSATCAKRAEEYFTNTVRLNSAILPGELISQHIKCCMMDE
jgi:hypothetical protein